MPTGNKKGQPPKYKNMSVDADIVDILSNVSDKLKEEFGFRPTLSQTLRHLLSKGAL
jgi:hypothetical protein